MSLSEEFTDVGGTLLGGSLLEGTVTGVIAFP